VHKFTHQSPLRCGDFVVASSSECTAQAILTFVAVLHFCDVLTFTVPCSHHARGRRMFTAGHLFYLVLSFLLLYRVCDRVLSGHVVLCSTYLFVCACVRACVVHSYR